MCIPPKSFYVATTNYNSYYVVYMVAAEKKEGDTMVRSHMELKGVVSAVAAAGNPVTSHEGEEKKSLPAKYVSMVRQWIGELRGVSKK
ncbi:MAG: hypothetical protein WBA22_04570 [Candidatus Methanofastidiosia archaeon]